MNKRRALLLNGKRIFTVTVVETTDWPSNDESYVRYNGTDYRIGSSFKCKEDDTILCYLYGNWYGSKILLDGNVVATAINPSYEMTVESNITVEVAGASYGETKMYIKTK